MPRRKTLTYKKHYTPGKKKQKRSQEYEPYVEMESDDTVQDGQSTQKATDIVQEHNGTEPENVTVKVEPLYFEEDTPNDCGETLCPEKRIKTEPPEPCNNTTLQPNYGFLEESIQEQVTEVQEPILQLKTELDDTPDIRAQETPEAQADPNPLRISSIVSLKSINTLINSNNKGCFGDETSEPLSSAEQTVTNPRGEKTYLQHRPARARSQGQKIGTSTTVGKEDDCDIMVKCIAIQLRELPERDRVKANLEIQKILMHFRLRNMNREQLRQPSSISSGMTRTSTSSVLDISCSSLPQASTTSKPYRNLRPIEPRHYTSCCVQL